MGITGNKSKLIKSINQKKYRQKYNKFSVEGEKLVLESIRDQPGLLIEGFYTKNFKGEIHKMQNYFFLISEKEMEKISALNTPSPILAVLNSLYYPISNWDLSNGRHLYLDKIKDPGNLGAILRVAEWFGISSVLLSPDCVDILNPKVVQSSMGSILRVPFFCLTHEELISQILKLEIPLVSATLDGENIYTTKIPNNAIICIGSESHGVSEILKDNCSKKIKIPAASTNKSESLNAAIATGIILSLI